MLRPRPMAVKRTRSRAPTPAAPQSAGDGLAVNGANTGGAAQNNGEVVKPSPARPKASSSTRISLRVFVEEASRCWVATGKMARSSASNPSVVQADVGAIDSNHIQGGTGNTQAMDNGQAQYVGDDAVGNQMNVDNWQPPAPSPRPDQDP